MTPATRARLVRAISRYEADPINTDDRPESWAALTELIDACKAAVRESDPRREAIRAAITNAYYEARNEGITMEGAADSATDAVLAALDDR